MYPGKASRAGEMGSIWALGMTSVTHMMSGSSPAMDIHNSSLLFKNWSALVYKILRSSPSSCRLPGCCHAESLIVVPSVVLSDEHEDGAWSRLTFEEPWFVLTALSALLLPSSWGVDSPVALDSSGVSE